MLSVGGVVVVYVGVVIYAVNTEHIWEKKDLVLYFYFITVFFFISVTVLVSISLYMMKLLMMLIFYVKMEEYLRG